MQDASFLVIVTLLIGGLWWLSGNLDRVFGGHGPKGRRGRKPPR